MYKRINFVGTFTVLALSLIMLFTHTWIFGLVGAAFCVKRAVLG